MLRNVLATILTIAICSVSQAQESVAYIPSPLDIGIEDFILKTGGLIPELTDPKIPRPLLVELPVPELKWRRFWDGSLAEAEAQGDLEIGFSNNSPEMPPFTLSILFTEEGIVLKHSNPLLKKFSGGYRLRPDQNKKKSLFIEGRNRQGVVAIVPPFINPQVEGVLLCSRDKDADASPYDIPTLRDTNYRMSSLRYLPRGSARGRFNSGTIDGLARAKISVGTAASIPDRSEDVSKMPSPAVNLGYTGKPTVEALKVTLGSGESFSTGVSSLIELETMAGHRRAKQVTSDIFLKFFGDKGPENIVIAGIVHPIDPGSCLMVVQRDLDREDLTGPTVKATPAPAPSEAVKEPQTTPLP
jgi:hypothetical protein